MYKTVDRASSSCVRPIPRLNSGDCFIYHASLSLVLAGAGSTQGEGTKVTRCYFCPAIIKDAFLCSLCWQDAPRVGVRKTARGFTSPDVT